jgi:transcriptional activator SPT8
MVSVWENQEIQKTDETQTKVSPVYSIDVQSEAVWLITGTEVSLIMIHDKNGSINLYTVRHDEGTVINRH